MAIDPAHPSPRFHNRGLYLGALLQRTSGLGPSDLFAVVQLPQVLPRGLYGLGPAGENTYILLEDILTSKLPELFGGYEIAHHAAFRVTRDMDVDLLEEEGDDLLHVIEQRLRKRQHSEAVRLEVDAGMSRDLLGMIVEEEGLHAKFDVDGEAYSEIYKVDGMLDMTGLMELTQATKKEHLVEKQFSPRQPLGLRPKDDIFAEIADRDILLHHPFDCL